MLSERNYSDSVTFGADLLSVLDQRAQTAIASEQLFLMRDGLIAWVKLLFFEKRIAQLEQQIHGSSAVVDAKKTVAESLRSEIADLATLLKEGYVDKQRIRQLDRSGQTLGEIADLRRKLCFRCCGGSATQNTAVNEAIYHPSGR